MTRSRKSSARLICVILVLLLVSCAGEGTDTPATEPPDTEGDLPAEAVLQAQSWLSDQLGVSVEQVQIVNTEQREWPDACLGLAQDDEVCAEVITPGWLALFEVNGQEYEVRTDERASTIRSPQVAESTAGSTLLAISHQVPASAPGQI